MYICVGLCKKSGHFFHCAVYSFVLVEIPPDLICDINCDCANAFIKFLLERQKWPEVLLLLTRKVSGEPPLGDCVLRDCCFSDLDLCSVIPHLSTWDQRRTFLLGCLIDGGGKNQDGYSGELSKVLGSLPALVSLIGSQRLLSFLPFPFVLCHVSNL